MSKELNRSQVTFLNEIETINLDLNRISDSRANFLVGVSGLILTIAMTQIFSSSGWHRIGFATVAIACFISILLSITVIRPRSGISDKNNMYYLGILKNTKQTYEKIIKNVLNDRNKIVKEYANEIYDLSEQLQKRFRILCYATDVLVVGLAIGMFMIIFMI